MPQKRATRRTERRESARADARLSMRVEGGSRDGDAAQIVTESQNISSSGIYCMSSHYLAPLSKVALTIVLPRIPGGAAPQELVKCDGIVVRCEPAGRRSESRWELACMFSGLEPAWRRRIEDFVTWRNLQALRAAAGAGNGERRARPAASTAKKKAKKSTARKTAPARRTTARSGAAPRARGKTAGRRTIH